MPAFISQPTSEQAPPRRFRRALLKIAAVFLAVGAGAILQVIVEVGRLVAGRRGEGVSGLWRGEVMVGAGVGVILMYATALLVPA